MNKFSIIKKCNESNQESIFINGSNWITKEKNKHELKIFGLRIYQKEKIYSNNIKETNKLGFNSK